MAAASSLAALPELPDVKRLSQNVIRILGLNPGPMTLQGTNLYLIGSGPDRVLLDTGDGANATYIDNLFHTMDAEGVRSISKIFLTHWHLDHTGGIRGVLEEYKKWKGDHPNSGKDYTSAPLPIIYKRNDINALHECMPTSFLATSSSPASSKSCYSVLSFPNSALSFQIHHINDGDEFIVGSGEGGNTATLQAIYTSGHTDDHVCFFFKEEKALFTGDTLLGHGTSVYTNLRLYMQSLSRLLAFHPSVIYPAHGEKVQKPMEAITMYIDHRNQREKQIFATISKKSPDGTSHWSLMDIVKTAYAETPANLHLAAANNVLLHLQKLAEEKHIVINMGCMTSVPEESKEHCACSFPSNGSDASSAGRSLAFPPDVFQWLFSVHVAPAPSASLL